MGLQINQYTNTATALDPLAVFDCDNWTGSAFQSEKVPMSVMESAFTKNIINSNLTQTGNRVQDFAGFTQYWKNNNQLSIESNQRPVSGANFRFQGFGTAFNEELLIIENNLGTGKNIFYGNGKFSFQDGDFAGDGNNIYSNKKAYFNLSKTETGGAIQAYAGNVNDYISRWYNTNSDGVINFRTNGNGGQILMSNSSSTQTININAQNGYIDVVGEYRINGNSGFTGTGAYTTFTIEGGIITNAV